MTFKKFSYLVLILFICGKALNAQIENVPIDEPVYNFLKNMSVKGLIGSIRDDNPNLSKDDISDFLGEIESKKDELSEVDRKLLYRYQVQYDYKVMNDENSFQLIKSKYGFKGETSELLSDKEKYLYTFRDNGNSFFFNFITNFSYSAMLKPDSKKNARLFDFGIYADGTLFEKLGYQFSVTKGGLTGDGDLASQIDGRLRYNFKFRENLPEESVRSYDFATGYLKYEAKPLDDMKISLQLGREKTKVGLGYSKSLVLSGQHADMDFIKFNFQYGIVNFSSMTASTVGAFFPSIEDRYTKYVATNRLKISIPELFDIGIGEVIIYARPLELAYLNPLIFYKFVEHSLQDRDNGAIYFDFQTHFIKGLQFQGTFFLDENIISNPFEFNKATNKTAIQFGAYTYELFGISNLTLFSEYTFIRPYVYSHRSVKAAFTSWEEIIGNNIGPNADQIIFDASYNFTDKIRLKARYSHTRKGENVYDENGTLIKNVGGDVNTPYIEGTDPSEAKFLDGIRINTDNISLIAEIETIKNLTFGIFYNYRLENNITKSKKEDLSFISLMVNLNL
ncbi:MAG: hypothetical protein UZ04_CHB001000515 [Chlorobi bacterium OLB4]|jgi:hypothetical protein|nr:MAG: hypothetical protein UZ04_CHB001000515 [Chlorobi bacterium OLB4]MBW7855172.1 hypothetical protein [Ignavibacteria bacterium]OQY77908.1 MAG: hypothetical protein B6D43_05190 [Ignavibacteriales bacterium UTCHB1]